MKGGRKRVKRERPAESDDFMGIRVDNELTLAADRVEQESRLLAWRSRIARHRDGHENGEEVIVHEVNRAYPGIAGETPDMPVGEAGGGADIPILKRDECGIVAHDGER